MKSFINFSEDLEDRKLQLLQKQKVMKQLEREKSDRSNKQFAKDMGDKDINMVDEKYIKKYGNNKNSERFTEHQNNNYKWS